jgi:acetamidase/formamidase
MIGPIAVRGAEPGMTLAVRIGELRPGHYGWTDAGGWDSPVNRRLGVVERGTTLRWTIDADKGTATNQLGHVVRTRPFLGVMGLPPAEPGVHSTTPPRPTGGNIDCRELVSGSTLYLPIAVPGALFSAGDGHAAQGDGEVSTTAIECPIELAELTFELRDDLPLRLPRAETSEGWLTFGFDEDLDEAMFQALDGMLDLLGERYGLGRQEALGLASVVVDLRVTQVVNRVRGVHAVLPHGAVGR